LGFPTAGVARVYGGKGNALTRRERGREKGHGATLTTPGSCDDGWWWRSGGAGVELRRRGLGRRRRCPRVERRSGDARLGEKLGKAEAAEAVVEPT
jgi:hypothetical protein